MLCRSSRASAGEAYPRLVVLCKDVVEMDDIDIVGAMNVEEPPSLWYVKVDGIHDQLVENRSGCSWRLIGQPSINVVSGTDKREMREGLRKIAELLAPGSYLFCIQSEMIRIS